MMLDKVQKPAVRVLELIGIFLIPASIIWGACSALLGLSPIECLIFSLGGFLITVCIIFRFFICEKVKSIYPIIILIVLVAAFLYSYKSILLKDTGLIVYMKKSTDIYPYVNKGIADSKEEIWFYGSNFHISLPANKEIFIEKLNEGINIRFLAHNPYSKNAKDVAKGFNQSLNEYRTECESFIYALKAFKKQVDRKTNGKGLFEFKFYDGIPRMRGYVFDPDNETATSIFVPYSLNDSQRSPGFVFKNAKDGVVNDYYPDIKRFWSEIGAEKLNKFPKSKQ